MSFKSVPVLAVITGFLLIAGSAVADKEVKFGKITDEEWQLGPPDDYPEANALVILGRAHLTIKRETVVTEYFCRMKVLTDAGVDQIGDQTISWHHKYDKIKGFKAHTITPDGKKHKVEKGSIFEKEVGDYKEKVFSFPVLGAGCIIEFKFSNVSESFFYLEPWDFQTDIYTLESCFSVTVPAGYTYNVAYQNVPPQYKEPSVKEMPDIDGNLALGATVKTYTWTRKNLPPITNEPYMSCEKDYRSSLRFQLVGYESCYSNYDYWESWPERGERVQRSLDEYCNKGKDVERLAQAMVAGLTDLRLMSRAIYEHVSAEYRTVEGIFRRYYRHENMSNLLETKSGSEHEKNLLLVEMHRAVGIPAWPVMISTRDHSKFDPDYPDLRQLNYILAYVEFSDGFEFLDCSNKLSPYGLLPPQCLTNGGLLIDGKQSQLIKIAQKSVLSERSDSTRMYVDADFLATCSTRCAFEGYYASLYAGRFEDKTAEAVTQDYFLDRLEAEYTLGEYECRLDSTDNFIMTVDYTSEDLVIPLDNNLIIKPVSYAFRSNPFKSEKRFFPVDFNYPFTYRNAVEIVLQDSVSQYILPEELNLDIGGASFVRECRRTDSGAAVVSTLLIRKPVFAPTGYRQLRDFFGRVAMASEDEITAVLEVSEP